MGLISVADLDARQVEYVDNAQAQAAIDDASAVARACVSPVLDDVEDDTAPAAVKAVVVGMVRRVLSNPRGLQSETLGDYTYAAGANAVATLLPTQREKRLLRQAAAAYAKANDLDVLSWGSGSGYMQGDLPALPAAIDEIILPSDQ
jgi:hypothetical protein